MPDPLIYEIPLGPSPRRFTIVLSGVLYQLTFTYRNISNGGWIMDLAQSDGTPMVSGVPLVTGANLLEQYPHFGILGALIVVGDVDPDVPPVYENLGLTVRLYYVLPA